MTDGVSQVLVKIKERPYIADMGANKVASWLGVLPDEVRRARFLYRREKLMTGIPENKESSHSVPKILLLDIETAPLKVYIWRLWTQTVLPHQLISDWFMLSWAAKWLLEEDVMSMRLCGKEVKKEDDSRIVLSLWNILNEADIVITHNGEQFDIPKIKSRFLVHKLPPTSFYQQVDTKKSARREFGFSSNKLDNLAKLLGIEGKLSTDFALWSSCMDGDEESLKYMETYNRDDVRLLEEVYLAMRPYIKAHPNYNLYIDSIEPVCPHCGDDKLAFAGYYYFTPTGKYRNYRCLSCGALSRERKTVLKNRKSVLVSNGK